MRMSTRVFWLAQAMLAALAAATVWLAPAEQTMGEGIRIVYIHVALIWTAMVALAATAVLGAAAAASARLASRLER